MKLTGIEWMTAGRRLGLGLCLMAMALGAVAGAQAVSTTTVQGTVYLANGQPGSGMLVVSWPGFTTASGQAVAADSTTVTIASDGFVSVSLTPNLGATPAGLFYTAVYYMSDGSSSTEYWVVPAAAQAALSQVQAEVMPAAQAVQAVSKAYVDQSIEEVESGMISASGGTMTGPLYLSGDPTQPLQAADKHYVDESFALAVPLAGGNMTGPLTTPAVNGVQSPQAVSSQTTLQEAMSAAGTNGAMEIPPTYAGTDRFTNPNGIYVADLRSTGAQQYERSVKEFGAVCDGVTDDTSALQAAINYAQTHGVALTIPEGTCKTHTLSWHGESMGGMGKQVSALMGFPGQDVLASTADSTNLLSYTRLHDLTIDVDQSVDVSCSAATGRAAAGSCAVSRPMESNSIFSPGGNGLSGTAGTGAGWSVGNCAIAMPALTGAGRNGLQVAEIENLEIAATGVDPLAGQYPGAHSTHTCGLYLAQWPQWSEFRNIDIRGLNTGIAVPALPAAAPAGLTADSNRWQNITIQATHGFTAAAGSNNVLDNVVEKAGNSAATGEPPTGLVLDLTGTAQGWTVRNGVVLPSWVAMQPQLTVTAAGGAVTGVSVGTEHGLGFDPYGTQVPITFSGSCTAAATASVNTNGSIGTITVNAGGVGCSGTTTASVNAAGNWDTAAAVNLIGGQNMAFFAGNLLKGKGGYTVWNAAGSESYGTQLDGGGGTLPGGGSYTALVLNNKLGNTYPVEQYPGVDFGAKLQACLGTLSASYGGTCDGRNFTGTLSMGSNLTISTANANVLLPCATISTANQIIVTAGTRNVSLRGCALRGASTASGSQGGTVFLYSGTGAMVQVGDPTYAADTMGFHLDNAVINTTAASSATAQGLAAYRTQELDLDGLYLLGNSNQTGMTLDGTGNYTGGSFLSDQLSGFQTAVSAIGHQIANPATTDWMNASTFVRLHIDCPMNGGNPISGTYGINLQQGDGNTFTGGDVEGCSTALHLGANAQNNTIVGLRNENSTNQVVADAGSAYNNWMSGGTMFTGELMDNGTHNSFLDTFHRSFNGINGDWYGSQKDATVTNHYRLGIGAGNERGLLDRYQTDYGYRWTMGLTDAAAGEQFYQVLDELNNVNRISVGQYNNGQSSTNDQTVINAAGTGAVVLNGSNNSGSGGVIFGSGGTTESTVATINNAGNAQFNGTLQVGGTSTFAGTTTVKNQLDGEIDAILWAGLTASQKESLIYRDWNGSSQWYMVKDQYNNWALNSATGNLDSFKAYQSTNSGDTYVNASNLSGVVRINYETGSGTGFKVYGGNNSAVYASFTGTTSIMFPGLAAGSGHYCLQIDNSGYVTNTGSACGTGGGTGGGGTVNSGTAGQIAYYTATGSTVGGMNAVPVTAGGTGAVTSAAALANLGGAALTGAAFTGTISATSVTATGLTPGNCQQTGAGGIITSASGPCVVTIPAISGDATSVIQAALSNPNATVNLTPGTLYNVTGQLSVASNYTILNGNGACIQSTYTGGDTLAVTGSNDTLNDVCLMPGAEIPYAAIHDIANNNLGLTINRPKLAQYGTNLPPRVATVYAYSASGSTLTLTANNYFIAGSPIVFSGFTGGLTALNGQTLSILSGGLSRSQFEVTTSLISGSGNDDGTATTTAAGYYWYRGIQVDTDEDLTINGFNAQYANSFNVSGTGYAGWLRCDATFCGSAIYSTPGDAAVGYVNDSALTMGCFGNGIDWESGNDLKLSGVILQEYNQFGLKANSGSGSGNITGMEIHNEATCNANPMLNGQSDSAGYVIGSGMSFKLSNGTGNGGRVPSFPNTSSSTAGTENYAYYAVIHNSGLTANTVPLLIGITQTANATLGGGNSVIVTVPTSPNSGDTCDILRVDQTNNGTVAPYSTSGLNYAIPGEQGVACGSGAGTYITFNDATPTSGLTLYNFAGVGGSNQNNPYGPGIGQNGWPAQIVLSGVNTAHGFYDGTCPTGGNIAIPDYAGVTGFTYLTCEGATEDNYSGNVWGYTPVLLNRRSGLNGATNTPSATIDPLWYKYTPSGLKGLYNFGPNNAGWPWAGGPTDAITLLDSNPFKTLATPGNRPTADAGDTAIGIDALTGGLGFRDSSHICSYIDTVFGYSSNTWLECLTPTAKTFTVPVAAPGITLNGGTPWTSSSSANSQVVTCPTGGSGTQVCDAAGSWVTPTVPPQYKTWECKDGVAGTSALATSGWPLSVACVNNSGSTWTITSIECFVDGGSGTTVTTSQLTNGGATSLLNSAMTCSTTGGTGTQSSTTTIPAGGYILDSVTPDGTAKSFTVILSGTY